jgi:hypothetical protein
MPSPNNDDGRALLDLARGYIAAPSRSHRRRRTGTPALERRLGGDPSRSAISGITVASANVEQP